MRRGALVAVAAGAAAATLLSGCSSSGSSKSTTANTAAAGKSSGPAASPSSSSGGGKSSGSAQVGVILPDTTSSTRYTLYDQPLLAKAFTAAGIKSDIQNAGGDKSKQAQIADAMIGEGVKVLLIDSIDAQSGAAIEQKAQRQGVKVIDYDRVNLGGTADYYVSFDNELVGRLQAQTLISCLEAKKVKEPAQVIEMDGGKDVDNNAVLFAKGAGTVFAANKSKVKVVSATTVPGWDKTKAAGLFQQALTANGGKVDGVLAANDDIANEVITVLTNKGLTVPVTGQDAGIVGLQNILTGKQCMTVFKNVKLEAAAAAALAISLIKNQPPSGTLVPFNDPKAPSHKIKALLLKPNVVTSKNVEDVVKAGALKASDICKGIASACAKAGVK